jgi:hypothetical protein
MNEFVQSDLDWLAAEYQVRVNDEPWNGSVAVGDTLEVNGLSYAVLGLNEDAIVVKELK